MSRVTWEGAFMVYADSEGPDQTAHPLGLSDYAV